MSPVPAQSNVWWWLNGGYVEAGDLCEGTRIFVGPNHGLELQRIWSNAAARAGGDPCVPALETPYYAVSAAKGWLAVRPGGSLSVPLSAWSSARVENWYLSVTLMNVGGVDLSAISGGSVTISTPLGSESPGPGCSSHPAINAGQTATLQITVPSTVPSGSFAVLGIRSYREGSDCQRPLDGDDYHFWPLGIVVE
jgi:hypothetical protein